MCQLNSEVTSIAKLAKLYLGKLWFRQPQLGDLVDLFNCPEQVALISEGGQTRDRCPTIQDGSLSFEL